MGTSMGAARVQGRAHDESLTVWGFGGFDNEAAMRWVEGLEDAADHELLEATLDAVIELDEEGDVPGASPSAHALAAAETVATLADRPARQLPEEVRQWCFDNPALPSDVRFKAVQALGVILTDSWFLRHFEERGERDDWEAEIEDLRDRLRS